MATKSAEKTKAAPRPEVSSGALLQRVIFPRMGEPLDIRSLYMDEDKTNARRARSLDRTALLIPADSEVSFAAYFNAFAASYWRRWTTVDEVELRLTLSAPCRVDVYRSKSDGTQIHVSDRVIEAASSVSFKLELAPFEDGGWYWFDVTSEDEDVTLADGGWYATVPAPGRSAVSIGITTFNRPDDCAGALKALGEDSLVLEAISAVFVADQGTKKVRDADGFAEAAAALGDRLHIKDQPNIGGSGGFARGMYESLTATDCEQILLMDDDIVIEPDTVLRALAFSRFATTPMLVGGQMLNLQARSRLHTMGEVLDRGSFMWGSAPHAVTDHDFAKKPLRDEESTDAHRRVDVDYNGWWMCLIPRSIVDQLGLPLPLFIKWDDLEYGLRASDAGYPTVSLPGVAIWHMPWSEKDDVTDWQAYFHMRNRLIVAALYGPGKLPSGLVKNAIKMTMKHLLTLEYSTVQLHHKAIQDFLKGPDVLFGLLPSALGDVRAERAEFSDGRVLPSANQLPLPSMNKVSANHFTQPPTNPITIAKTLASALVHNVKAANPEHHDRPQLNVAAQDARWFLLSRVDGATVGTSDGRGITYRKRDPETFRLFLRRATADFATLNKEFRRLSREYRAAMPKLTSIEAWRKVFEK
jgi:galactofuranosylgalactofuranosylrhamnosyl-N-acetylglucosaminyl-diphospho-decaprenol beta-1,5/1,6-galactofuranosyltransferase